MTAAQTLTLDSDYGSHWIGGAVNTVVEIYAADGTTLRASNDDAVESGSPTLDSYLSHALAAAGTYLVCIRDAVGGGVDIGESHVLNASLTGQTVTNASPVMGYDTLTGGAGVDRLYGDSGNDVIATGTGGG